MLRSLQAGELLKPDEQGKAEDTETVTTLPKEEGVLQNHLDMIPNNLSPELPYHPASDPYRE